MSDAARRLPGKPRAWDAGAPPCAGAGETAAAHWPRKGERGSCFGDSVFLNRHGNRVARLGAAAILPGPLLPRPPPHANRCTDHLLFGTRRALQPERGWGRRIT